MKRKKVLWIDVETSGTNPEIHDVWSLAYLVEINGKIEHEEKMLIRPSNFDTIDLEALKVGGITVEELEKIDYTISDAVRDLKKVWKKYIDKYNKEDKFIVGGYFVRFDVDFLRSMFQKVGDRYGIGSWCYTALLDVPSFVAEYMLKSGVKFPNFKLETVCNKFGIEFDAHDAMEDIRATRELYYILKDMREVL